MSAQRARVTPESLGFYRPKSHEIVQAIDVVLRSYDGQKAVFERTSAGNVGKALREVCGKDKVIIPGPIEFFRSLREAVDGEAWCLFPKSDFVTEAYAKDVVPLPSAMRV
mgnify:CR=1 FL=1